VYPLRVAIIANITASICSVLFLLSFFRLTPSAVRSLQDNYHFLCPITKSDVSNKLEKVWPKGLRLSREKSLFVPIESPQLYSALFDFSRGCIIGSFYTQSLEVICSILPVRRVWLIPAFGLSQYQRLLPSPNYQLQLFACPTYGSDKCKVEIFGRELFTLDDHKNNRLALWT
jgi:hypothetical protein